MLATLALVLGAGFLARAAGLSRTVGVIVALATAVSYATLRNGALVWSEPLFCAILVWLLTLVLGRGVGASTSASRHGWPACCCSRGRCSSHATQGSSCSRRSSLRAGWAPRRPDVEEPASPASEPSPSHSSPCPPCGGPATSNRRRSVRAALGVALLRARDPRPAALTGCRASCFRTHSTSPSAWQSPFRSSQRPHSHGAGAPSFLGCGSPS